MKYMNEIEANTKEQIDNLLEDIENREMVIYMKNENYKIWADTKTYSFHIQMNGEDTDPSQYKIAATAIEEAEKRNANRNS